MKKNERLMEQLGEVDDKFIAEAAPETKTRKNPVKFAVIGTMAAAAAGVVLWQSVKNIPDRKPDKIVPDEEKSYSERIEFPENTGELPIIHTQNGETGGMGFEGFWAYDVSELLDGNPSRENCEFTELPVFIEPSNEIYSHGDFPVYTMDEMEERLKDIAGLLTDEEFIPVDRHPNGEYYKAEAGDISLSMTCYGRIGIEFGTAVDLPDEYGVYHMKGKEQAIKSLDYLGEKYRDIIQMDNPTPSLFTDYDIYGNSNTTYRLFDNSDDLLTALMNYNFRDVYFCEEEIQIDAPDKHDNPYDAYEYTGDLTSIYLNDDFSYEEFAGMYPVISYDEAYDKLIGGDYYTTVWEEEYLPDGINTDDIFFTGISYKRTADYKYTLPYYRFLVELHPERTGDYAFSDGMKEYGAFYIPAVSPDYLVIENEDVAFN